MKNSTIANEKRKFKKSWEVDLEYGLYTFWETLRKKKTVWNQ